MESTVQKLTTFSKKNIIPILYILLTFSLIFSYNKKYLGLSQDQIFKFIQVTDLIKNEYRSFERFIPNPEIDPNFTHKIYDPPFEHVINKKVFSVFPWLWTLINAPFYQFLPYPGLLLLSFLFGFLSLIFFRKLLLEFHFSPTVVYHSQLFYLLSTPLVVYSSWYYEATLCSFLLYFTIYQALKAFKPSANAKTTWMAVGIFTGLHLFLRVETGFFSGLIISMLLLFRWRSLPVKQALSFLSGVIFTFVLFFYSNRLIYGIYEPLIVYDVIEHTFGFRFKNLIGYLFLYRYSLAVYFPASFLSLFYLKNLFKTSEEEGDQIALFSPVWLFILTIPFVAAQEQGIDLTPRYLFPAIPLLATFVFRQLQIWKQKNWKFYVVTGYSGIFILLFSILAIWGSRESTKIITQIAPHLTSENITSSKYINNFAYGMPDKTFYLCETKEEIINFYNSLKQHGSQAKMIITKIENPEKFRGDKNHFGYQILIQSFKKFQEIETIPNKRIIFENKNFYIFEFTNQP